MADLTLSTLVKPCRALPMANLVKARPPHWSSNLYLPPFPEGPLPSCTAKLLALCHSRLGASPRICGLAALWLQG